MELFVLLFQPWCRPLCSIEISTEIQNPSLLLLNIRGEWIKHFILNPNVSVGWPWADTVKVIRYSRQENGPEQAPTFFVTLE